MYIEMLTIVVQEGFAEQVAARFTAPAEVEKAEGFLDLSVMAKRPSKGEQEVIVMIRWSSEAHWKAWEVSEPHLEGHRRERERGKPPFVVSSKSAVYAVHATKGPAGAE
ncbi:antibiotic biosynthesis monooxygenase [Paenibacillus antri]|uniref:Antibiotic biosynthesis monooxygenase n=1 Tax=Paenibacillus antri TaxID=2582848 RepID=A0A5R9G3R0_9BACL|nr:antibiotic biosynthesis monooxygenase [Paenibacillus antri]TLS48936.1 antibiotic biosynthesis monooxygenase [Paenibacillus antri]